MGYIRKASGGSDVAWKVGTRIKERDTNSKKECCDLVQCKTEREREREVSSWWVPTTSYCRRLSSTRLDFDRKVTAG